MRQVQNDNSQDSSHNLNLRVYELLKSGFNPTKICSLLNIKKTALQYYLSSLKKNGFIRKIGYGTWEILKDFDLKEVQKSIKVDPNQIGVSLNLFKPNMVRGHAFMIALKLRKIEGWEKREQVLLKKRTEFKHLNILGGGQSLVFRGRTVWITNKSIIVYELKSYLSELASKSKQHVIYDFLQLINGLENIFEVSFKINKRYVFTVNRQHYSLVQNALAKQYDSQGRKLFIKNWKGFWMCIDNSYNLHELETFGEEADVQNKKVQDFFNGLEALDDFTPQLVMEMIGKVTANQLVFAENQRTHIGAVQNLSNGVIDLVNTVGNLDKRINDFSDKMEDLFNFLKQNKNGN